MTYDEIVADVVKGVEALGAAVMVGGAAVALIAYVVRVVRGQSAADAYRRLRQDIGRTILLGLELLIIGDIVRTIVVDPTFESVAVLGLIVLIRVVLSFSLEVELDGVWPWNRWRADRSEGGAASAAGVGRGPQGAEPTERADPTPS